MTKLALFIESKEAYLDKMVREQISEWGFPPADCVHATEWKRGLASTVGLFSSSMAVLDLTDKKDLKAFVELITNRKKNELFTDNWYGNGLVIFTTGKLGATKVIKLVEEFGGKVHSPGKPEESKRDIIKSLGLRKELSDLVSSYVGDDYDLALPVVNSMETLSKEEKAELSIEDLYAYLPQKPGSIPPWEYVDGIFLLNPEKSIDALRRTLENTFHLAILAVLKGKINLLYKYVLLDGLGVKSNKAKAKELGLKSPYVFFSMNKMPKKPNLEICKYLVKLLYRAECDLKGETRVNPKDYLETLTMKIILSIKHDRPIGGDALQRRYG